MANPVFDYQDYKKYLGEYAETRGRGFRKSLAEAARCQTAYISHVFNGTAHFSWEQAEAISRFIGHSELETEYFLHLVEFTRAGTPSLRDFLSRKLGELREKHLNIMSRVQIRESVSPADQARYYSAWYYAAIHVLLTLPGMDTAEALSRHLKLSPRVVAEVLDFLSSISLIVQKGARYEIGSKWIHLERNSPLISKHHTNWRLQAVRSLENMRDGEVHYSSAYTLSVEDITVVRKKLVDAIEQTVKVVKATTPEKLCALTLDFWEL